MHNPAALESVRLKLKRAQGHLEALDREIRAFLDRRPYGEAAKFYKDAELQARGRVYQGERFYVALYFEEHTKAPAEWGTAIGDVLHNLRSALDHLAFALAGSDATDRTQFPICVTRKNFADQLKGKRLAGVGREAVRIIKWIQPYRRGKAATSHPLWLLHKLNNIDKHQLVHVAGAAMFDTSVDVFSVEGAQCKAVDIRRTGPMEDDTVFAVLTFAVPPSSRGSAFVRGPHKVHIKAHIPSTKGVVFDVAGPAKGGEVVPTLTTLLASVRDRIVPSFHRFFS